MKKTEAVKGCVYTLTNLINRKQYVGQHKNVKTVERRWERHLYDSEKGTGQYIHVAISSYGAENFFPEVIWAGSVDKLNEKEIYYIKKLHTFVDDPKCNGYNLTTGGGQCEFFSSH